MPIVKRTARPVEAKRKPKAADPYAQPGKPIEQLIKEHDKLASDAAWRDDHVAAKTHEDIANSYRQRLADGELYELDF